MNSSFIPFPTQNVQSITSKNFNNLINPFTEHENRCLTETANNSLTFSSMQKQIQYNKQKQKIKYWKSQILNTSASTNSQIEYSGYEELNAISSQLESTLNENNMIKAENIRLHQMLNLRTDSLLKYQKVIEDSTPKLKLLEETNGNLNKQLINHESESKRIKNDNISLLENLRIFKEQLNVIEKNYRNKFKEKDLMIEELTEKNEHWMKELKWLVKEKKDILDEVNYYRRESKEGTCYNKKCKEWNECFLLKESDYWNQIHLLEDQVCMMSKEIELIKNKMSRKIHDLLLEKEELVKELNERPVRRKIVYQ